MKTDVGNKASKRCLQYTMPRFEAPALANKRVAKSSRMHLFSFLALKLGIGAVLDKIMRILSGIPSWYTVVTFKLLATWMYFFINAIDTNFPLKIRLNKIHDLQLKKTIEPAVSSVLYKHTQTLLFKSDFFVNYLT